MADLVSTPVSSDRLGSQPQVAVEPQAPTLTLKDLPREMPLKWTWSCREVEYHPDYQVLADTTRSPQPGDVVLVQLESTGYHTKINTADNGRLRLYPSDVLVCVFGNRYATDAYEGRVEGTEKLHILTGAGMVGTVQAKYRTMKNPTNVTFLGYLGDEQGHRINLKDRLFRPRPLETALDNVIMMIGTGMNSGKTTTAVRLVKSLLGRGVKVATCKLTGSVSHQDLHEMSATTPHDVRDFSDYGFPSTYLCETDELVSLFETMLTDALEVEPDVIVMEVADGLLQQETDLLLRNPRVRQHVRGVIHTAACASSALFGLSQLEACGHEVIAVSGLITNSPLFVQELSARTEVPIASSAGAGEALAELAMRHVGLPVD